MQDEGKKGIEAATIKIDSIEEPTKSNADGKFTLAKDYEIGATLSIEVSKPGYETKSEAVTVKVNNGNDNLVIIQLKSNPKVNYFSFF